MQGDRVGGEVANLDIEDLVYQVTIQVDQSGLLENQLAIDHECEKVPDDEEEVEVAPLLSVWRSRGEQLLQRPRLLIETGNVRYVERFLVDASPIRELHLGRAPSRTLRPEEHVV